MYPALAYDTSIELAEENKSRKQLHTRIMETNPAAFHR